MYFRFIPEGGSGARRVQYELDTLLPAPSDRVTTPRNEMTSLGDLMGPEPVLLPADAVASRELADGVDPARVAAAHPTASAAWAGLAERASSESKGELGGVIAAYAFARTGYHRGLDSLRRNGWKGFGPVPWSHEPNRGFLRCVAVLARAAQEIGEEEEHVRCLDLLDDCDPTVARELGLR